MKTAFTRNSSIKWSVAAILLALLCVMIFITVAHAGTVSFKGRQVFHIVKSEMVEVGDKPGHYVGYIHNGGLLFLDDGEVATVDGWYIFDYTNGSGHFSGYGKTIYDDGSTQLTRVERGNTTAMQGGKVSLLEGKMEYVGGTGRFKGIKGNGTFSGKRVAPVESGADGYIDITGSYTIP